MEELGLIPTAFKLSPENSALPQLVRRRAVEDHPMEHNRIGLKPGLWSSAKHISRTIWAAGKTSKDLNGHKMTRKYEYMRSWYRMEPSATLNRVISRSQKSISPSKNWICH
ncbi:hypothetical protein L6452_09931 [Arctium lappa]|uniref:Uncharacterized protein n=1 Tax=Arctium lappa TaxID=4217 RepID=A0ACB9DLC8_ARCLA|nr:hypothetical protein L6452_09931 [Arctium lappa]